MTISQEACFGFFLCAFGPWRLGVLALNFPSVTCVLTFWFRCQCAVRCSFPLQDGAFSAILRLANTVLQRSYEYMDPTPLLPYLAGLIPILLARTWQARSVAIFFGLVSIGLSGVSHHFLHFGFDSGGGV